MQAADIGQVILELSDGNINGETIRRV